VDVLGIATGIRRNGCRTCHHRVVPQQPAEIESHGIRHPDPLHNVTVHLLQQLIRENQIVLLDAQFQQGLADAATGDSRDENVGVK
jgi:hypothetical protein